MASKPAQEPEEPEESGRRRLSRELPPNLSDLLNQLIAAVASFIQKFDSSEKQMRQIVAEFRKVSEEVRNMQKITDSTRKCGAVIGGTALVAGALLAPVTGGVSLIALGVTVGGGAGVATANVLKHKITKDKAECIESLGKEFMELSSSLKEKLEEIRTSCERLENESSKVQTEQALKDMKEFQTILRKVSELKDQSKEPYFQAKTLVKIINEMLLILISIFTITPTPEEDKKLRDSIVQSADQCQKVTDEFAGLKKKLHSFKTD